MAKINIQNATVTRHIQNLGFACAEPAYKTRDGQEKRNKFTVWTDNASDIPPENSVVNVTGNVSAKAEQFTNDKGEDILYGQLHVNQPRIVMVDMPRTIEQAPEVGQPNSDNWQTAFTAEAPF